MISKLLDVLAVSFLGSIIVISIIDGFIQNRESLYIFITLLLVTWAIIRTIHIFSE